MPIKIPQDLPASDILEKEGVLLIKEHDAIRQDIRPLRILLLNLMPKKIETETQIARVLAGSPLQIEITLLAPSGHQPRNTSREHMLDFYRKWEDIKTENYTVGKNNGYKDNLIEWFKLIYEVVFGVENGPRLGFFISFFGRKEMSLLIKEKIN